MRLFNYNRTDQQSLLTGDVLEKPEVQFEVRISRIKLTIMTFIVVILIS